MASIDAQIQIMLKGTSQLKVLQDRLNGIEQTINQISGQAIDVVLGRATDVTTYANALKNLNNERQKAAGILQSETDQINRRNQAIRQSLAVESALRKERSYISRYTREFAVETKGLNQSEGTLKSIKERFDNISGAITNAFKLGDLRLIRSYRTELRTLVQEQRDWNRTLTGTKNTGVNPDFLREQARGYSDQIRALRERAAALSSNEQIIEKLAAAEYNLVQQRTESGTFTSFADPRLGRELLSNAKALITQEEKRAKVIEDTAKANERLSSAAVSLEKQRQAALEKIFAVEEKIRSGRRISRSEAADYYFQAQLPRLALPFGDPSAPSMRGGARRTGVSREILGGSRTIEEAQTAFRAVEEGGGKAAKKIKQSFVDAYREMLPPDTLLDGLTALGKAGKDVIKLLQKKTVAKGGFAASLPAEEIRKQRNQIIAELQQVAPGVDAAGDNIASTFASSIRDGASSAVAATTTFAEAAKKALKKAFGIASPSRFMIELVRNLVDTYIAEMQKSYPRIQSATDKAFGRLTPERTVSRLTATNRGFEFSSVPSAQYSQLPIRAFDPSGAGGEMDEMFRRFRNQIASLTTQPEIYRNLLNALPSSRITTDLVGAANRRAIASEIPSFMSTQRMLGPGELERVIAKAAADYFRTVRTPDPWVGLVGDYRNNFVNKIIASTQKLTAQPILPPGQRIAGALPPALFESGLSPSQEIRRINAYRRSAERAASVMAESGPRQLALPPASTVDAASSTGQRNVRQAISDLFDRISTAVRGAFGGGGGFGGRGAGGGAGGAGDPAGALARTSDVMRRLGSLSSLTNNQLEELEQQFVSLRNQADATGAEFRQLTDDLARINREQARRDPNADFLTRRFGPRAAQGISEGLIGGAFPILFGQGMGASLGGLVGGGAGGFIGGNLGFGLSLLGTALGSVFDQLNQAAQETGKSLNYPIEGFEKLKEAGFFASRQQEYYISKLIESGRTTEATAQIQAEMIRKIGVTGVNDLMRLGDASSDLSKAWAEFNLQLQAALAGPMAGLLEWLTGIVNKYNEINRQEAEVADIRAGLSKEDRLRFDVLTGKTLVEKVFGIDLGPTAQEVAQRFKGRSRPQEVRPAEQTPEKLEEALRAQVENADRIRSLARQGEELDRKAAEMRRNNEETVFNLRKRAADMEKEAVEFRRSVEDQIFTKRQELETKLAENERKRQQNAIDALDLQFQKISTGLDPVTQGVVSAASEYLKIRAEGEANLQLAEKQLKLELQRIDQEVNRYKLQVEDRISQMAIQRDEFSRDVAKARLQMAQEEGRYLMEAEDYRLAMAKHRYEVEKNLEKKKQIAAQEGLTVETKGGYTGTHVDGFPITSRPGRRKDPLTGEQRHHRGVDIAAPVGTALGYEIAGEVISAGWIEGYGNTLKVKLENGMEVLSAHLNEVFVTAGQKFQANQRLATVGSTGRSTGPHTHQESWMEGKAQPYASLPFLQLGKAVSGQASSDIYYVEGVGWFSKSTRKMVSGPGKAPAGAQVTSVVTGAAPTPPSPPGMPALPGTPELVGVNDLMQQYVEIIERLKVATVDNNKAQVESNRIAAERAFLTMQERAMSPVRQAEQQTREIYEEIEARRLRNRLALEGYSPEIIEGEVRVLALQRDLTKSVQGYDLVLAKLIGTSYDGTNSTYESAIAKLKELEALGQLTPAQKLLREELEKILKARRGIIDATGDAVSGARGAAKESIVSPREKVEGRIGELKKELKELTSIDRLAITSADNIGNAFGGAFRDIITGAASTEEALGGFFKNVADSFAAMAVEIIAKQMTMIILQTILKALGAVAGGTSTSNIGVDAQKLQFNPAAFSMPRLAANGAYFSDGIAGFANGGAFTNSIVSSPTLFQFADGGVMKLGEMGEAGPEAVMPLERDSRGRLGVRASGLAVPFGRPLDGPEESDVPFQRKAVGLTVPFLRDEAAARAGEDISGTIDVRFETVRIGDMDVVTREEARRIGQEAAQRGAQLAQRRIKNNPSVRRDIGMR